MCVATSTIIGVSVAAASVASQQIAAKKQRDAAKDAAATQTAAADKALGQQQTAYQQQRQDFSPYAQAGQGALTRLGQSAGAPVPQFASGGRQPMASLGNPMGGQMPQNPGQAAPGGQMGTPGMPQGGQPMMPPQGPPPTQQQQLGQQQAPTGKMVLLRAPDGSTRPFPEAAVPQVMAAAQAKGHQLQVVG